VKQYLVKAKLGCDPRWGGVAYIFNTQSKEKKTPFDSFSAWCEYMDLDYERIHVIYRVSQAEYVIRIRVAAPQECVNTCSTRRVGRGVRWYRGEGPRGVLEVSGHTHRHQTNKHTGTETHHTHSRYGGEGRHLDVGLYKIFSHLFLCVACARINHPFITPAHPHYPHYCNTIARRLRHIYPPPDPPFICHTPYNIGNGNIV